MIEMLGVLAIIGVLSVGGIAGYSKAMMKYKINKAADQISTIVANTRTLFASQKKYTGLVTMTSDAGKKLIKKAHLAPDEMYESSTALDLTNPFGGGVDILVSDKSASDDARAFFVTYYEVPEEACMELATMDWGSSSSSGLIAVGIVDVDEINAQLVNCTGDTTKGIACPNGLKVAVPMPVDVAATKCSGSDNYFSVKYY